MLIAIREKSKKVATFIIVLLIIPFAFFGIESYFTANTSRSFAEVNGVEISQDEFNRQYQNQRARVESSLQGKTAPESMDKEIREQVKDNLIQEEILYQFTKSAGFQIASEQVAAQIGQIPNFQVDGKFSEQVYEGVLNSQGMTPSFFEASVFRSLAINQLQTGIRGTGFVTTSEVEAAYRLQFQTRDFDFVLLKPEQLLKKASVTDAEAQEYFAQHASEFQTKEKVTLEYLELDAKNLLKDIQLEKGQLEKLYEEGLKQGKFGTPEERSAAHILVNVSKDADKATSDAAKKRADEILAKVKAGADFAALAKESSDDKTSAAKGGDLGKVQKGQMVKSFEDALFALKKEQPISDLVQSEFGFHIIQLKEIHAGKNQSFDEVKGQLEQEAKASDLDSLYFKKSDQLTNLAYEHADELNTAAEALGLKVQVLVDVTRDIGANAGLGREGKVVSAAFSQDVLEKQNNSEPVEIGDKHIVILRSRDHQPRKAQTFEEVAAQVKQQAGLMKAQKLASSKGSEWVKSLQSGKKLEELIVGEDGLQVQQAKQVNRGNASYEPQLLSAVFAASRPTEAGSYFGISLDSGGYALVHLKKVEEKAFAEADKSEKLMLSRTLGMLNGGVEFEALADALKKSAEIEIREAAAASNPTE